MQFKLGPALFIGITFLAFLMTVISVSSDSWVSREIQRVETVDKWEIGLWQKCTPICIPYSASHGKEGYFFSRKLVKLIIFSVGTW